VALRATSAGAESPSRPRVVLLSITEEDPLAARLAAELEALGLDVSRAAIDPAVPIDEMVRMALAGGARGVVVADGRRTEFWVAEEGSDRIAMRQELEIEQSPAMESVLSLRTVEFLRVSLGLTGHAVIRPPPGPRVKPRREPDKRIALGLLAGVVASTGRLAPFAAVGAGLRVRVVGPAGLELRGLVPIQTHKFDGPDGPVDTTVSLVGGGLVLAPPPAGRGSTSARARWPRSSAPSGRRRRTDRPIAASAWRSTAARPGTSGSARSCRCGSTSSGGPPPCGAPSWSPTTAPSRRGASDSWRRWPA
jgi:hypothetical protein